MVTYWQSSELRNQRSPGSDTTSTRWLLKKREKKQKQNRNRELLFCMWKKHYEMASFIFCFYAVVANLQWTCYCVWNKSSNQTFIVVLPNQIITIWTAIDSNDTEQRDLTGD